MNGERREPGSNLSHLRVLSHDSIKHLSNLVIDRTADQRYFDRERLCCNSVLGFFAWVLLPPYDSKRTTADADFFPFFGDTSDEASSVMNNHVAASYTF